MLLQILLLLGLSALLLYWLAVRHTAFWRKRGIPGPASVPIKGNLDQLFGQKPAVLQFREWTKQYGPVYGIQEGRINVLVTSDPDMVRQMLVEKFELFHGRLIGALAGDVDHSKLVDLFVAKGKRWKRLRSIATPAFSMANLKRVMPTIDDSIRVTMDLLETECRKGQPINVHVFFTEMTVDVISRIAMGQRESLQFRTDYPQLLRQTFAEFGNNNWDYAATLFPWLGRNVLHPILLTIGKFLNNPFVVCLDKIRAAVVERKRLRDSGMYVEEVDGKGNKRVDFIDLFLEAEADSYRLTDQSGAYCKEEKFERKNTLDEIVKNCFLFVLAGFDTTANSLSIVSHNLAMHPDVQQRLWEEIDAICPDDEPTYEQLNQLKYAEAVVKETLRLLPIGAAVVNRVVAETTSLGNVVLEKGTAVKTDLFTLHHDKRIWGEDADEFRPERWLENSTQPQNFYGFGGGPRICIGMRLAMLEEKMALAHLLKRFVIKQCPQTEKELELSGQAVLNPASVTVELEERIQMVD